MRIEEAIHQKTFKTPQQRAQINIIYTAGWLNQFNGQALKPFGISIQQFNILRILRGRKGQPATVKLLTSRMLDKMSNASRLVDKLVAKGLVDRCQSEVDQRKLARGYQVAGSQTAGRVELDGSVGGFAKPDTT